MNKKQLFIILIISTALCSPLAKGHISQNINLPTLNLGISADYPPFAYQKNGQIVGFEVDLAKAIAAEMNHDLNIHDMDFSSIIPSIKSGRIDLSMSALAITPERAKSVDFSKPYYEVAPAIVCLKESTITSKKDLAHKRVAAQLGSTLEELSKNIASEYDNVELFSAPRMIQLIEELKIGRVDAVLVDAEQAKAFAAANPNLQVILMQDDASGWAAAFPKGSLLQHEYNNALQALIDRGALDSIKDKWLGEPNEDFLEAINDEWPAILYIIKGSCVTLQYTLLSVFLGLILGSLLTFAKIHHSFILRSFAKTYTSIFRGTPLLVQLSLVYFALPTITGYQISAFMAGIIAFSLNSGAYLSESIRGGIESIDKGQFEAAQALGVPYRQMMKDIIMPQALRNILPALVNEIVNLLKETAIISVIGASDLMRRAQVVAAEKYSFLMPLLVAAACYYILVLIFSSFAKYLEFKLKQS